MVDVEGFDVVVKVVILVLLVFYMCVLVGCVYCEGIMEVSVVVFCILRVSVLLSSFWLVCWVVLVIRFFVWWLFCVCRSVD